MPVYFVQRGDAGPVKIGFTNDIERRVRALQTAQDEPVYVRRLFDGDVVAERALHARFAAFQIGGEWFEPAPEILYGEVDLPPLPLVQVTRRRALARTRAPSKGVPKTDPGYAAYRAAAYARGGAITRLVSSLQTFRQIVPKLRPYAAEGCSLRRERNLLKHALTSIEFAFECCPDLMQHVRERAQVPEGYRERLVLALIPAVQAAINAHFGSVLAHAQDHAGSAPVAHPNSVQGG